MQHAAQQASTGWVPLKVDATREVGSVAAGTMLNQIGDYVQEEQRGGLRS